jgi:hypothetical protein
MRRIGRWIFNIAAVASLVMCLIVCVGLWILIVHDGQHGVTVNFGINLDVPPVKAICGTALLPVAWIIAKAIGHYRGLPPASHCQRCDYDLTANVSGVCPECGMKIERSTA